MRTAVFYVPNEIQPADGLWQSIAEISSLYCNDDAAERDLRRQAYPAAAAQSRVDIRCAFRPAFLPFVIYLQSSQ